MGVKYTTDGKIQDLHFTITLNSKCNLSCNYCPLINNNLEISYEVLDYYIDFFIKNINELKTKVENIVFIFFGGEPLLSFEKIQYFIKKTYNIGVYTKYVIYTNGLLINNNILDEISTFEKFNKRIIFYISIDGGIDTMLKNRLNNVKEFNNIIKNINLLNEYNIQFSITKVISILDNSQEIYNSFLFLDSLNPLKIDFLPEAFSNIDLTFSIKNNIILGINLFIEYLKNSRYLTEMEISEYFGLPDSLNEFKYIYQVVFGIYCDFDGTLYYIIDALSIFNINKTFNDNEKKLFTLSKFNNDTKNKLLILVNNYLDIEKYIGNKILEWYKREFFNDVLISRLIGVYLIKKIYIKKFEQQDKSNFFKFKRLTFIENYNYSDVIYPHELLWYNSSSKNILKKWENYFSINNKKHKLSLVINIPFCETKCFYCTHEIEVNKNKLELDNYISYLEKEAIKHFEIFGKFKLDYLYIGGGTPSILSENQLERLFGIINSYYDLTSTSEKMMEFSPNTFSEKKIEIISKFGINKVTFGIQDIDENLMRENNRIQTKEKILQLFNALKKYNINYINIDIMAGLKNQTFKQFKNTLDFVLSIQPDNICLNIFKPTHKVLYNLSDKYFLSEKYLKERDEMIKYWREKYYHKEENIVDGNIELYNFDNPNTSFLSLGYGTNGHIFGEFYYKFKSLNDYFMYVDGNDIKILGYNISIEEEIIKYIILNFKENGISLKNLKYLFGDNQVLDKIFQKVLYLKNKGLVEEFEKRGIKIYRYIGESYLDYSIYVKYFYNEKYLKELLRFNNSNLDIDKFLEIYFVN